MLYVVLLVVPVRVWYKYIAICSRKDQHSAQIYTTALFHMLAPTYFGSSLPSSGSFWIRLRHILLCLCHFLTLVRPGVITPFNLFFHTRCFTHWFLSVIYSVFQKELYNFESL
jgi:hypothetical protein